MSFHEAAVEALERVKCLHAQTYTEGGPFMKRDGSWSDSWTDIGCAGPGKKAHSECILAALVRSEAVRVAGYEIVHAMWDDEPSRQRGMSAIAHFLAALAPPEAT